MELKELEYNNFFVYSSIQKLITDRFMQKVREIYDSNCTESEWDEFEKYMIYILSNNIHDEYNLF